jgi:tRNA (guanine37-N1)-methyltransferase
VPEVLVSGHHEKVRTWRLAEAERITRERRPDLWAAYLASRPAEKPKRSRRRRAGPAAPAEMTADTTAATADGEK